MDRIGMELENLLRTVLKEAFISAEMKIFQTIINRCRRFLMQRSGRYCAEKKRRIYDKV